MYLRYNFKYLGEVRFGHQASRTEAILAYETLTDTLGVDVLYFVPTQNGTSIFCGIDDIVPFLSLMQETPKVAGWALYLR